MILKISLYISELLQLNNTLIISGFGQFILKHQSANIDKLSNKFLPPSKIISFNPDINYDDDILLNFIVQKEESSKKDAQKKIDNFTSEIKFKLKNKEEVKLEGLGLLYIDSENKINFKQEKNINLSSELFGLQEITLRTITKDKPEIQKSSIKTPIVNNAKKTNKLKNIILITSPIVILVLILVYFAFYTSYLDNTINKLFSKNTENINSTNKNTSEIISIADSLIKNDTLKKKINSTLDSTTIKRAALFYQEKQNDTLNKKNNYTKYYIIAGSFRSEKNAKKFASILTTKGYSSEIISFDNNLFRISIKSFTNEAEALKELYKIRAKRDLKSVWLFKSS